MLVGHLGAGLAAKAVAPRVGLGTLVAVAFLLDILLWLFVTLHLEGAVVPGDFAESHRLAFSFPWSHSLVTAIGWSAAAAFLWSWSGGEGKYFAFAPAVVAATTFSHWILDALTHAADLPLWPAGPSVGLGLDPNVALVVELVLAALSFGAFLLRTRLSTSRRIAIGGLTLAVAALTIYVDTTDILPTDALNLAGISLLTIFVIVTIAAVADRETR